jgi:hypothetical protein
MKTLCTIAAATLIASTAGAQKTMSTADSLTGTYDAEGSCPGQNGVYRGIVTVTKPDALYAVRWQLTSGQVSTAKALEQDGRLAIAYELDGSGGVMMMRPTATGYAGSWAMFRATSLCTERWQRR